MKNSAKIVGTVDLTPKRKLPDYMKPCKVQFGSLLRKALSKKLVPVNRAGRVA